jgi:hypothetical protein
MYPLAFYPPVEDPAARVRARRRPGGEDRPPRRWRPFGSA